MKGGSDSRRGHRTRPGTLRHRRRRREIRTAQEKRAKLLRPVSLSFRKDPFLFRIPGEADLLLLRLRGGGERHQIHHGDGTADLCGSCSPPGGGGGNSPPPSGNDFRPRGRSEEADARSPRMGLPVVPSHPAEYGSGPDAFRYLQESRGVDGNDQGIPAGLCSFLRRYSPPLSETKGLLGKASGRGGLNQFLRLRHLTPKSFLTASADA